MPEYIVKVGNNIMTGSRKNGDKKLYVAGDTITLSIEEAAKHADGLEPKKAKQREAAK